VFWSALVLVVRGWEFSRREFLRRDVDLADGLSRFYGRMGRNGCPDFKGGFLRMLGTWIWKREKRLAFGEPF
jgi:hypothetical protein